ncbi:MAG: hypothetical protein A3G33_08500 [Omnitrophica bacterium RIFCSPLOWO2_12_FULL_44_17]|uniref:Uncharacterized protein n=1 Tax=Candidatus Danuiimicrobium aquiferis TaxID=1801832 RepID=A0A1G1KWF9_9BACT|nr:MAG: hypothetical protein A3B72_03720 [Omnitrophica bacterium RIFCSPHIGHO2_02_FULL_45_28]OGW90305.1 MAG: hypothetical protein A3E74_01295 [Omnitrophica bacterium RIFCSPHIGHO2_12_FULL_44_12]OGW97205.1 MAG: hypothetical protein A3G33_08500 [Omnitrophica bacterium RIFCSPLOWO2_12_FULL_44_17]OGX02261.1 MAG: hypothetical protein A3J12_08290 [Omnitrophica bacterium RIFCSPLOWO2_02_FULL_44_11]
MCAKPVGNLEIPMIAGQEQACSHIDAFGTIVMDIFLDMDEKCRLKKMFNFIRRVLVDCFMDSNKGINSGDMASLLIAESWVSDYIDQFTLRFKKRIQFELLQTYLSEAVSNKEVVEKALLLIDELDLYFGPAPVISIRTGVDLCDKALKQRKLEQRLSEDVFPEKEFYQSDFACVNDGVLETC